MNVQDILQQIQTVDVRLLGILAMVLIILLFWRIFSRISRLFKEVSRLNDRLDRTRDDVRHMKKPLVETLTPAEAARQAIGAAEATEGEEEAQALEPAEDSFSFSAETGDEFREPAMEGVENDTFSFEEEIPGLAPEGTLSGDEDIAADEKSFDEEPKSSPWSETLTGETLTEETPAEETGLRAFDEPEVAEADEKEPAADIDRFDEFSFEEPAGEEFPTNEAAGEEFDLEEPAEEEPAMEEFSLGKPADEELLAEEPSFDEPILEEPAIEEPAIEEPAKSAAYPWESPAMEQPSFSQPAEEEPEPAPAWEPVAEESPAPEPGIGEPEAEEPAPAEPVVEEKTGIVRLEDDPSRPGVCFARCQDCDFKLAYPARLSGKGVRCPSCKAKHVLP